MNQSEGIEYFYKRIQDRECQDFLNYCCYHLPPSAEAAAKRLSDLKEASKGFKSELERLREERL